MSRAYPPAQWYWFIRNTRYLGLVYWDTDDYDSPSADERELMIEGRGEFTDATAKPSSGTWEIDDVIPEDLAWGVVYRVISELYDHAPTQSTDQLEVNELKARKFWNKWKQKEIGFKRYFGKNRRTSAGTVKPFDLR